MEGAAPHVQLTVDGLTVQSEAVGNNDLDPQFRLDDTFLVTRGYDADGGPLGVPPSCRSG